MEEIKTDSKICTHCGRIHPGPLIDETCPVKDEQLLKRIKDPVVSSSPPILALSPQIKKDYTETEKKLLRDNYNNLKSLIFEKKRAILTIEREIDSIQRQIHLLELYAKSFMDSDSFEHFASQRSSFLDSEKILSLLSTPDPYL